VKIYLSGWSFLVGLLLRSALADTAILIQDGGAELSGGKSTAADSWLVAYVNGHEKTRIRLGAREVVAGMAGRDALVLSQLPEDQRSNQPATWTYFRLAADSQRIADQRKFVFPRFTGPERGKGVPWDGLLLTREHHLLLVNQVDQDQGKNGGKLGWIFADCDLTSGSVSERPVPGKWPYMSYLWSDRTGQTYLNTVTSVYPHRESVSRWNGLTSDPVLGPGDVPWIQENVGNDGTRQLLSSRTLGPILVGYGPENTFVTFAAGGRNVRIHVPNDCSAKSLVDVIRDQGHYVLLADLYSTDGSENVHRVAVRAIVLKSDGTMDHCVTESIEASPARWAARELTRDADSFLLARLGEGRAAILHFAEGRWQRAPLDFESKPVSFCTLVSYEP